MESIRQPSLLRVCVVLFVVFVLASWAYQALSQQDARQAGGTMKVEVVQDNGSLLGVGDVRFGVAIEPGGGAVVSNWQNFHAVFIDDTGRFRDLGIRLKHQHTAIAVPPDGIVVFEDQQGDYYAIDSAGKLTQFVGLK